LSCRHFASQLARAADEPAPVVSAAAAGRFSPPVFSCCATLGPDETEIATKVSTPMSSFFIMVAGCVNEQVSVKLLLQPYRDAALAIRGRS